MPIPLTKFSKRSKLYIDISNNSRVFNNYILTCDISDTLLYNEYPPIVSENKRYLSNKANHLINPLNVCSNKINKFNNEKKIYRQIDTSNIRCYTNDNNTSLNKESIQKNIQNQVSVYGSLYTNILGSLYTNSDNLYENNRSWNNQSDRKNKHGNVKNSKNSSHKINSGIDIKHNSYDRYLAKKKSQNIKTHPITSEASKALYGNKTRNYGIINCIKNC